MKDSTLTLQEALIDRVTKLTNQQLQFIVSLVDKLFLKEVTHDV